MTIAMEKEFYLVQKCWFDGPNIQPPVDYLALFADRGQAQEVASRSAYLHAAQQQQQQAVARTILLPTGYAFSAAGELFWIRSVRVSLSSHQLYGTSNSFAHAIFSGNVIGGTGNINSRRGSEASTGVVFVGPDSHAQALQAMNIRGGGSSPTCRIACIPLGPLDNFLDGWAGANEDSYLRQAELLGSSSPQDSLKRSALQASNVVVCHEALPESSDFRPLKRQCGWQRSSFLPGADSQQQQFDAFMQLS